MQTHNFVQGSAEWHKHRLTHFNASDAPAMLGCSPYKSRADLLRELKTGIAPEVDAATQRRFDDGHRFEALARPLAEKIVGDDLAPVVGSLGELSASFDGLTLMGDTGFEHKSINDELRACMKDEGNGYSLPKHYQVQMEQQLIVSGAERVLFMATRWEGETCVEQKHCWYASDPKLRAEILAGWKQFAEDLAAYVSPVPEAVAPAGRAPDALPALRIEVTGMVTASNLAQFKETALAAIRNVNRELLTDQDFSDADSAVKWCSEVESRLKAAKDHALSQTESIDLLFKTMDDISVEARAVRLELEKLVKARKEARRGEIVAGGGKALADHIAALNARLGKPYMPTLPPALTNFGAAITGKRNFSSMQDAVDALLAQAKIEANAIADRLQVNLDYLRGHAVDYAFLFADTAQIIQKAPEDLQMLVKTRIADHQAAEQRRLDAQREAIRAEEQAKAEADARAKIAAEVERQAAAQYAETAKATLPPAATQIAAPAVVSQAAAPSPTVLAMPQRAAPAVDTGATIRLGQISDRLGFAVTADFLRSLGFEPCGKDRAAVLYRESSFSHICAAIVKHIEAIPASMAA